MAVMPRARTRAVGVELARAVGLVVALAGAVTALLLVGAPTAGAATGYQHAGAFGGACGTVGAPVCPADGLFRTNPMPQRIAIHEASGKVFVADSGDNRIQVFAPGSPVPTFAFAVGGALTTPRPVGLAIDQDSGDLYVASAGTTHAIVKLSPDDPSDPTGYSVDPTFTSPAQGVGAGQIGALAFGNLDNPNRGGLAIDPATGDLIVGDPGRNLVHRVSPSGAHLGSFNGASAAPARAAFTGVADVAVAGGGDIIVADIAAAASSRIDRFSAAGQFEAALSVGSSPVPNTNLGLRGLAIAANPASDEVFVASSTSTAFAPVPGKIFQFAGNELVTQIGVTGDGLSGNIYGVGVHAGESGGLYAVATQVVGTLVGTPVARVQSFDAVQPPVVEIDPVDLGSVTEGAATFSGQVDPRGNAGTWRFEYRRAGIDSGWPRQTDWTPIEAGTEFEPVDAVVGDLEANTLYEVRLVATNPQGLTGTSGIVSFTTAKGAPHVTLATVGFITHEGATLRAAINPRSAATEYWFEYGTDTGYGSRVPATSASAGSGRTPTVVSQDVSGLEPGETYHFRVVAENDAGMRTEGPDRQFGTLAASRDLGPERAFERVSTMPTGGTPVTLVLDVAPDGERVIYESQHRAAHLPLAGDEPHVYFVAERQPDRWDSRGFVLFQPIEGPYFAESHFAPSRDLTKILHETNITKDPDDQNHDAAMTVEVGNDLYLDDGGGSFSWVSRDPRIPLATPQTDPAPTHLAGKPLSSSMSVDADTVVFGSERQLLDTDATAGHVSRLYKRGRDGDLQFVGRRPDGTVPANGSFLGSSQSLTTAYTPDAVSADGSGIIWGARRHDAASGSVSLYVSRDGEPTVEAAREQGVPVLPSPHPLAVRYYGADRDASRVFFTSASRLTPDSGGSHGAGTEHSDLYVYDVESATLRNITPRLDGLADPSSAPAVENRARVRGVVEVDDAGRRVYFVADGRLTADPSPLGITASASAPNLYVAELGPSSETLEVRFVATLNVGDTGVWTHGLVGRRATVAPTGTVLAFGSTEPLTGVPTGGFTQVFVYDDEARSLVCASCPRPGMPTGHANASTESAVGEWPVTNHLVSRDGVVFFDTPSRLVDADENAVRDVYEYRAGQVRLVSSGSSTTRSKVVGASADAESVFFLTVEALAPDDNEAGIRKLYVARVGGGFAAPTSDPSCVGDACQSAPSGGPPSQAPGTATFEGRVDEPAPRASVSVRGVRPVAKRAVSVRVRTSSSGAITVQGPAVRRTRRQASRAATYTIRVALNPRARRTLQRRGRLKVRLTVAFSSEPGSRGARAGVTVVMRKANRSAHNGSRRTR